MVLAAGEGRRAGGYKPLFSFGKSVRFIDRIICAAQTVCREIRVVGGAYFDDLSEHLTTHHPQVKLIRNLNWKSGGMFSSVQKGLENVDQPCFIHPADIPGPQEKVYQSLINTWKKCKADVLRPTYHRSPGHPVLVSLACAADIVTAHPSQTLRDVLRQKQRLDVPVSDPSILKDYDTEQDLAGFCSR